MPSSHLILCRPLPLLPQSLPTSGSFPVSQLFSRGGRSIGVSAFGISLSNEHPGLISFRVRVRFLLFCLRNQKKKKKSPNLLMGTTEQFSNSRSPVLAPIHFSRCLGKDQHRWFKWKACLQKESLSAACPWGSISSGIQRSRWVSQFPDTVLLSTHPCRRSCLKRWSWYPAAVFSLYNVGMLEMYYEVRTHPKYS